MSQYIPTPHINIIYINVIIAIENPGSFLNLFQVQLWFQSHASTGLLCTYYGTGIGIIYETGTSLGITLILNPDISVFGSRFTANTKLISINIAFILFIIISFLFHPTF